MLTDPLGKLTTFTYESGRLIFGNDYAIPPAAFTVHADLNPLGFQESCELLAGELSGFNRSTQHL